VWVASMLMRALRKQQQLGDDSLDDEPAGPLPPPSTPPPTLATPAPPVPLSQMSPQWRIRTRSGSFDESVEGHRFPATPTVAAPSSTNTGGGSGRRRSRVNSLEVDVGAIFGLDAGGSLAKLVYFEATDGPLGGRSGSETPAITSTVTSTTEGSSELGGGAWGLVDAPSPGSPLGGEETASSPHSGAAGAASRLMRGLARPTLQRVRSLAALNRTPAAAREALHAFYDFMSKRLGPTYVSSTVWLICFPCKYNHLI